MVKFKSAYFIMTRAFYLLIVSLFFCVLAWSSTNQAKVSYKRILKEWTRHEEVYGRDDFYASLKWYATYQSPEFIQAKIKKITEIYGQQSEKKKSVIIKAIENYHNHYVFYLSVYTYNHKNGDLTSKDSVWELALNVNGDLIKPDRIKLIPKLDPLYQALFPYSNVWSRHYLVLFPKKENQPIQEVSLNIHGPFGKSELKW